MKRLIAAVLCFLLTVCTVIGGYAETRTQNTAKNSVVRFYVEDSFYYYPDKDSIGKKRIDESSTLMASNWTGSGFAIGEKGKPIEYLVTNRHVVESDVGNGIPASNIYIILDFYDRKIPVDVVKMHDSCDIAIVHLATPITEREAATLRPFDYKTIENEPVYALGFPGLADDILSTQELQSTVDKVSVRDGMINRVLHSSESLLHGETIQMDAQINSGDSGGPLVDKNGYVLGVNTFSIGDEAKKEESIFGALSVNELIVMLDSLRIPYMTAPQKGSLLVPIIIGVAALAAIAVILLLLKKRKPDTQTKKKPDNKHKPVQPATQVRHLVGQEGQFAGKSFTLDETHRKYVIGRQKGSCHILFAEDTKNVSRIHCTVRIDAEGVTVTDENSTDGTYIDGKKLPAQTRTRLHRGNVLSIGRPDRTVKQTFILKN